MSVVTLTTDFGLRDHYCANLKGALLARVPGTTIVDITHNISAYNIVQAAFIFRNAWVDFPKGTIHLIAVNDLGRAAHRYLLLDYQGHFFVAPDNGLFYLIFGEHGQPVVLLPWPEESSASLKDLFAETVARLAAGEAPGTLGEPSQESVKRITLQAVINRDQIRGTVIYIDHYDNVILNVSRDLFERVGQNRPFALYFKRHDPITTLATHYCDVPVGEPLCRFNAAGLLEIAINMGKAAGLFGLQVEDTVQIDFNEF